MARRTVPLSHCAKITSARAMTSMRPNGIVPSGQEPARLEVHPCLVRGRRSPSAGIVVPIQDRLATETRRRSRPADVLEYRLVAHQGLAGPVAADQAEHPV